MVKMEEKTKELTKEKESKVVAGIYSIIKKNLSKRQQESVLDLNEERDKRIKTD